MSRWIDADAFVADAIMAGCESLIVKTENAWYAGLAIIHRAILMSQRRKGVSDAYYG